MFPIFVHPLSLGCKNLQVMYHIDENSTNHSFDKLNLMTISGRKGGYDILKCKHCGMNGKRYALGVVNVSETYSEATVRKCPKAPKAEVPQMVKVLRCGAMGRAFANLVPDSIHAVVTPPEGYENDHTGVWVMGVGEPVKLVRNEFTKVE